MATKFEKNGNVKVTMTTEQFETLVFVLNQIHMNADFSKNYYESMVQLNERESEIFSEMVL